MAYYITLDFKVLVVEIVPPNDLIL
jgi:hypothetical protein